MAAPQPGSQVAKDLGLALAQIYNHIKAGRVKNYKADGYPNGKGIEVDPDEVKAAIASMAGRRKSSSAPKRTKVDKDAQAAMHDALDAESEERKSRRKVGAGDGNTVRLRRYERGAYYVCPVNPSHGSTYQMERAKGQKGPAQYHCSHQEHDGRLKSHPAGFAPATQNVFTEEELSIPQPIGRLGAIMLEWIMAGRTDLSEGLEAWMTKQKLDVWIPTR